MVVTEGDEVRIGLYGCLPFFSKEQFCGFGSELLQLLFFHILLLFCFTHHIQLSVLVF